jgi:hypothetical protein
MLKIITSLLNKVTVSVTDQCNYQQVAHYSGVKRFNKPPLEIKRKIAWNPNKLKQALRKFPNTHSFYALEEGAVLNIHAYNMENLTTVILKVCWYLETQNYFKLFQCLLNHANIDCKIFINVALFYVRNCIYIICSLLYL